MENIHLFYEQAKEILLKYPGVKTVGIGLKEVDGSLLPQVAFKVYVSEKRSTQLLTEEELIPASLFGFPTDVLNISEKTLACGRTRPLVGGISVSTWDVPFVSPPGSIGCVVEKNGSTNKYILSNEHVLGVNSTAGGSRVFQPSVSECAGFIYNEVGSNENGKKENIAYNNGVAENQYYIDCAIAKVNSDISVSNSVREIDNPINGHRDISNLSDSNLNTYAVKKCGSRTDLTTGIIEDVALSFDFGPDSDNNEFRMIVVRPNPGKTVAETYLVNPAEKASIIASFAGEPMVTVTDVGDNKLKFESRVFAYFGDSGSVVMNNQNEVVGLLFSISTKTISIIVNGESTPVKVATGKTYVCHIGPVLQRLNIRIAAGTFPAAGEQLSVPGIKITRGATKEQQLSVNLKLLEENIKKYPKGRDLLQAVHEHFPELAELVHHRRPVLFTWNKFKGPAFMAIFLRALNDPGTDFQKEHEGVSIVFLLNRMREVLVKEGSSKLKESIAEWGDDILNIASGKNINQSIHYLM